IFDKRVSLLYEKALRDEIELHFVSDGQVINSQLSAVEKFNFSISLGLAKYYSDAISDNVKRAQEQMLRMGTYPSRPSFGYKRVPIAKDKTEIVVDEYASRIVQKAYEWYATGSYSLDLLRKKLKEEYGVNWSHGWTDKILKDTFYYGVMKWNKKFYPHKYPPILTKVLFDQVQQIKAGFNKKRFKFAGLPYIYRGLLRCADCGLSITPEKHKGIVYYHCTQYNGKHGAKWITEAGITEQLGQVFKNLQLPTNTVQEIMDNLNEVHQGKIDFHNKHYDKLVQEQKSLTTMMDNLYLDRLKGRITEDDYDKFFQSFNEKKVELETRLALLSDAEDNYYITAKYLLDIANRAYDLFIRSEVEERRQLVKLVLQNIRLEGKLVRYDALKPFDTILNYNDNQLGLPQWNTTRIESWLKEFLFTPNLQIELSS
ncbi:MAG: recombinase family protein, partial [Rhabdochlamydiaceae bacterium]